MTDHQLYSKEAERQILGSCLVDPSQLDQLDLSPDDFHFKQHQILYSTMVNLNLSGITPDVVSVQEQLDRQMKLDQVTPSYITELIMESGLLSFMSGHVRIVKDYAHRRSLIRQAEELAKIALDRETPITDKLPAVVDELTAGAVPRRGAEQWAGALSEYYDWLEERAENPTDIWGMKTGFVDFDKLTGGVQTGDLVYVAGKPGIGKSIFTAQVGLNMARQGEPGAIYSLEMMKRQLIGRLISGEAKVDSYTMKQGRMTGDQWSSVTNTIEGSHKIPLYISDDAMLTSISLRADLARLKIRHGLKWCVLDYDMLLQEGDNLNEIQFTSLISKRLKNIARDLNVAMITVSSVTKDYSGDDDIVPTQAGLRGSNQKSHNADIAGFLTAHIPNKKEYEARDDNLRTFTFVKGREMQELGFFHLVKLPKLPAFGNYSKKF